MWQRSKEGGGGVGPVLGRKQVVLDRAPPTPHPPFATHGTPCCCCLMYCTNTMLYVPTPHVCVCAGAIAVCPAGHGGAEAAQGGTGVRLHCDLHVSHRPDSGSGWWQRAIPPALTSPGPQPTVILHSRCVVVCKRVDAWGNEVGGLDGACDFRTSLLTREWWLRQVLLLRAPTPARLAWGVPASLLVAELIL
jgi:hypothetical protein